MFDENDKPNTLSEDEQSQKEQYLKTLTRISTKYQYKIKTAKTTAKQKYYRKKLFKNNETIANILRGLWQDFEPSRER